VGDRAGSAALEGKLPDQKPSDRVFTFSFLQSKLGIAKLLGLAEINLERNNKK